MAHPGLQCFYRDTGFIAHRAESDSEVMTADMDVFPGRKRFAILQKLLMRLRFSIPALMAPIDLVFKEGQIGFIFPDERR